MCLYTVCSVWSKITLIIAGVGGAEVDPPTCKPDTFFLRTSALIVPIASTQFRLCMKWHQFEFFESLFMI